MSFTKTAFQTTLNPPTWNSDVLNLKENSSGANYPLSVWAKTSCPLLGGGCGTRLDCGLGELQPTGTRRLPMANFCALQTW